MNAPNPFQPLLDNYVETLFKAYPQLALWITGFFALAVIVLVILNLSDFLEKKRVRKSYISLEKTISEANEVRSELVTKNDFERECLIMDKRILETEYKTIEIQKQYEKAVHELREILHQKNAEIIDLKTKLQNLSR